MINPRIYTLLYSHLKKDGEFFGLVSQKKESEKIKDFKKYDPIIYYDKIFDYNFLDTLIQCMKENDVIYFYSLECLMLNKEELLNIAYSMLNKKLGFISSVTYTSSDFLENTQNLINSLIGGSENKNANNPKLFVLLKTYTNNDGDIIDLLCQEEDSKKIKNYDEYISIIYRDKIYDFNFLNNLIGNMKECDVIYFHNFEFFKIDKHMLSCIFNSMLYKKIGFISYVTYTSSDFLENTYNLANYLNEELIKFFNFKSDNNQLMKLKPSFGEKVVNGKHIPDPKEKEVIELIRKYVEEDNYSLNKITILLNKDKIRTKTNKSWYVSTLKNIIEKNNIKIKKNV